MGSNKKPVSFEDEITQRVRRIEVRLTNFIKQNGFDPARDTRANLADLVWVTDDGALVASNADVPIGDVMFAAIRAGIRQPADVFVGNHFFGRLIPDD